MSVAPEVSLIVRDLTVEFFVDDEWVTAVDRLSFTLSRREALAIVGESGSGKSTTAMALLGLLPPNARVSGTALLGELDLLHIGERALRSVRGGRIGMIFQDPMTALNPVFTIGNQIVEAIRAHRDVDRRSARERALELLRLVELPDPAKAFGSYPHEMSGGQRQRAMIAQALACDPEILIADEPTTALDVTVQAEILNLMRSLRDRLDSSIILVTHDMGVVADLADRVVVMKGGMERETAPVVDLFHDPQDDYTKALLAAVPRVDETAPARVTTSPGDVSLTVSDLVVEYRGGFRRPAFRAVDGVSLEIGEGEVLGLVGESGSGKSTVGRAIAGLTPIHSGDVRVAGQSLSAIRARQLRAVRRRLGVIFQDPGSSLNPRASVKWGIAEPLVVDGVGSARERERRVFEMLDRVELSRSFADRFPHELSGGQRQRVAIARALVLHPELLIADEPTSALDVSVQARVLELFQTLQEKLRFATLFITHDLAVVELLSDRLAVIRHGKIVETGLPSQLLRTPREEYTRRLIDAVPVPDPIEQRERREQRQLTLSAPDESA